MPNKSRVFEANRIYHVFNRRTERQQLFPSSHAYDDFLRLVARGRDRYHIRICSYCLMDTHWHLAIWVREQGGTAVVRYLQWLSSSHALRFRVSTNTRGEGHVYQDRYKSLPVHDERHYFDLVRYIEANPVAAGLVARAEHWPWSAAAERVNPRRQILDPGPVALPLDWVASVNDYCHLQRLARLG